jgi:hypothetical protein
MDAMSDENMISHNMPLVSYHYKAISTLFLRCILSFAVVHLNRYSLHCILILLSFQQRFCVARRPNRMVRTTIKK